MNCAELIAELQKWPPACPVRVVITQAYFADESGETMLNLSEEEAMEAREVKPGGGHVLIVGD